MKRFDMKSASVAKAWLVLVRSKRTCSLWRCRLNDVDPKAWLADVFKRAGQKPLAVVAGRAHTLLAITAQYLRGMGDEVPIRLSNNFVPRILTGSDPVRQCHQDRKADAESAKL